MLRTIFRFLASLQFAIVLLIVLIAASIAGTLLETQISADMAQKWIYNNWLFNIWLSMLCVNLFCVAAIRYPWKRHQTGFVITHAGIITLLIGSMIDRIWGIEGMIHLYSDRPGSNVMELHEQVFTAVVDGKRATTDFKINTLGPRNLNSPDAEVKVEVVDVQPVERAVVPVPAAAGDPDALPVIQYTLQGPNMGRHDKTIFFNERETLLKGMADAVFVGGTPAADAITAPRKERFYVIHKLDQVMNKVEHGEATGATAKLIARGGSGSGFDLQVDFQDKTFKFPLKYKDDPESALTEFPLAGLPDWRIRIIGYYPHFVMREMVPDTLDDDPVNPVAIFELIGPPVKGAAKVKEDPLGEPNGIAFYLGADDTLRYLVKSRVKHHNSHDDDDDTGSSYKTGEVKLETPIPVSWAPGAQCVVHEFSESARRKIIHRPEPEKKGAENVMFGMNCRVTVGADSKNIWVGQAEAGEDLPQEIEVGGKKVNLGFTNRTVELPFVVSLKKFRAPTDEGSKEFAAYESILGFDKRQDTIWLKSDSAPAKARNTTVLTGAIIDETATQVQLGGGLQKEVWIDRKDIDRMEKLTQKISMNRPTTYPPAFLGPYLGLNYKFSQASTQADKGIFNYSGVQVLRDPGWFFKWFGCIMIVFGIYTMFYLRPYFNRGPAPAKLVADGKVKSKGKGKAAAAVQAPVKLRFFEHPLAVLPLLFTVWPLGVHLLIASRAFKPAVKIALIFVTLGGLLYTVTQLY